MSADNCPHCGAEVENVGSWGRTYACFSVKHDLDPVHNSRSILCREREARQKLEVELERAATLLVAVTERFPETIKLIEEELMK
jgi:hypothetical protein